MKISKKTNEFAAELNKFSGAKIKNLADKNLVELIKIRRHLHAHPELSYKEFETSSFIQQKLSELNIPFAIKATTGVIGLIKGKNPDKRIIALRADMDALPIKEENNVPYKSKNEGVMHACGHDVHTTCLLGAAKILNELKNDWEGTVKLIFQPGEEKNPGGASLLIKEGVLNNKDEAKGKPMNFSVKMISKDNYQIQLPEQLEAGEYGFVWVKNMDLKEFTVFAFGIDWKSSD